MYYCKNLISMFKNLNRNCIKYLVEFLQPGGFVNAGLTCTENSKIFNYVVTGMFTSIIPYGLIKLCNKCTLNNNANCIDISNINLCMPLSEQYPNIINRAKRFQNLQNRYIQTQNIDMSSLTKTPKVCSAYTFEIIYLSLIEIFLPKTWQYEFRTNNHYNKRSLTKQMTFCEIKHPREFMIGFNNGQVIRNDIAYFNWQIHHFHDAPYRKFLVDKIYGLPMKYHFGPPEKYRSIKAIL